MSDAGVGSQMEFGVARWQPSPLPQVKAAHFKESCAMPSASNHSMPTSAAKPSPCPLRACLRTSFAPTAWQLLWPSCDYPRQQQYLASLSHHCPCLIGEAEALSLGEDKKPILDLYTLTTEERVADDDTDVVIRWATTREQQVPILHALCRHFSAQQGILRFRTVGMSCRCQASYQPDLPYTSSSAMSSSP